MNKDQYKRLQPFENQMRTAATTGWVRMTKQQLAVYAPVYGEVSGKPMTSSQLNCPRCVINALKDGWRIYEAYKKRYVKEDDDGKQEE